MSTTNRTESSLPMPSWALPVSPKASFGRGRDRDPGPDGLPSSASLRAGLRSPPTVSESGAASLPKVE